VVTGNLLIKATVHNDRVFTPAETIFTKNTKRIVTEEGTMALSKELLEILACPKCVREPDCTGDLEYREQEQKLICHHCKLAYDIKDDIPVMLIDEASPLS
jgi:uncharacterized protein YbaR (Trm112 family)